MGGEAAYLQQIRVRSQKRLFDELRIVRLSHDPNIFPYRNATFEIRLTKPQDFQPSGLYVLGSERRFVAFLLDEIVHRLGNVEEIDTIVEYENEFGEHWRMIPPIVEYADFGKWMILDGGCRSLIALSRGIKIPMLFISNVDPRAPYPYTPLPQGWDSVNVVDAVPADASRYLPRAGLNDTEETQDYFCRDEDSYSTNSRSLGRKRARRAGC